MASSRFQNKIALVCGGSRGIGRSVSIALAREGARVFINYERDITAAEDTRDTIAAGGGQAAIVQASVANEEEVLSMFADVRRSASRLDILVNCAGVTRDGYIKTMSFAKWQDVLNVDLTGCFLSCRSAFRLMSSSTNGGGAIVTVSSVSGLIGPAGQANYAAAKAGVIAFTKVLAREAAAAGIRANAVVPGLVDTAMIRSVPRSHLDAVLSSTALQRLATPAEIAAPVLFLASEEASYITGQTLIVDGGLL